MKRTTRINRTGMFIATALVLAGLILALSLSLKKINARLAAAENDHRALAQAAQALEVENDALEYQIRHSGEAEMIARVAWEKLGLVQPGEVVYYDIGN